MATSILRGGDHGLPDYNTAREALGLKRKDSFLEINPHYNDSSMSGIDKSVSVFFLFVVVVAVVVVILFNLFCFVMVFSLKHQCVIRIRLLLR